MYNFNHLYYFYMTVKSGSVTLAAKRLRISQPSLTSQLKVLEGSLRAKLFNKVGRNNYPTEYGNAIFGFCQKMFETASEMHHFNLEHDLPNSRRIRIGVSDEFYRSSFFSVVSHFLNKFKPGQKPKILLTFGSHSQLAERLRFQELDVMVSPTSYLDPELVGLEQLEIPVVLICSSQWNNPFNRKNSETIASLKESLGDRTPIILPSTGERLEIDTSHFCASMQYKGEIVLETNSIESMVQAVSEDVGVAFLPLLYIEKQIREKKPIRIIGPQNGWWNFRLSISSHSQNANDSLIKELSHSFKETSKMSCEGSKRFLGSPKVS